VQNLSNLPVQKGHISEVEISNSSGDKESNVRKAESKDESSNRSLEKPQEEKESPNKPLPNSSTKKDRKMEKKQRSRS